MGIRNWELEIRRWCFVIGVLCSVFIAAEAMAQQERVLTCPCKRMYNIQKAQIAFLGRVTKITEVTEECPGFECRVMEITFAIEEPWKNVPPSGEITFRTDDTSCGYGYQLSPPRKQNKIGEVFGIFAEEKGLSVCNSVVMNKAYLQKLGNEHPNIE